MNTRNLQKPGLAYITPASWIRLGFGYRSAWFVMIDKRGLTIDMNIWIGNRQYRGNTNRFACDITNRSKIRWNRYTYIKSFLCIKEQATPK